MWGREGRATPPPPDRRRFTINNRVTTWRRVVDWSVGSVGSVRARALTIPHSFLESSFWIQQKAGMGDGQRKLMPGWTCRSDPGHRLFPLGQTPDS